MPRIARKVIDTKYFHVMVQGIGRDYVFEYEDWKEFYIQCMQKAKQKENVKIIAFCVMGNHVHILVKAETIENLSKFMHMANSDYSRYYNRENKRVGHVFRNRYRSEPIKDIKQLINCLAYIHNNPVKASMMEKAEDYKWSSYINYLTGKGVTDFEEASIHFDISPNNLKSIMQEKSFNWMEYDDKEYENKEEVLTELIKKYNINSSRIDNNLLKIIAKEIHDRCGTSYREIANLLEVSRERLRLLILSR
jgi:REP element-mobilizing transposase RayT